MFLVSLELYFQWLSLCTCMRDIFFSLFILIFSSLLAFCLFPLLFLFSLGMTFATISESSLCLFLFFICNVFLFPLLSFFPTLKGVENFCLPLKSFSQLSHYTRCIAYLRSKTALAFYFFSPLSVWVGNSFLLFLFLLNFVTVISSLLPQ